jgi:hypothetical protein
MVRRRTLAIRFAGRGVGGRSVFVFLVRERRGTWSKSRAWGTPGQLVGRTVEVQVAKNF